MKHGFSGLSIIYTHNEMAKIQFARRLDCLFGHLLIVCLSVWLAVGPGWFWSVFVLKATSP